jgi:hypothetical protein
VNIDIKNKFESIKSLTIIRLFFTRDFFQSNIIRWLIALNLFLNIVDWAILSIFIRSVDGGIILHYNIYFGVDNIGDWKQAYAMPLIGLILFVLNLILAYFFYFKKERIASYTLLLASLMAQMCLIVASISVIMINY